MTQNKNVTKMGMIIKVVYCIIFWATLITKSKNMGKRSYILKLQTVCPGNFQALFEQTDTTMVLEKF